MATNAIKRIARIDMKEIENINLKEQGIYINFNEENILEARAMIIGPKDTPFENGVLFFNITFPNNYPYSPPNVTYYSTSRYRIHPNLYVGRSEKNFLGKVCLSILNTWSGPKWTSIMHIGSILISIQSLLCENPLHNEPGFENENSHRNSTYNMIVEYDTYCNLISRNCFNIPEQFISFTDIIHNHIKKEKDNIITKIGDLASSKPKREKITLNIYNISLNVDYPKLRDILIPKINLI